MSKEGILTSMKLCRFVLNTNPEEARSGIFHGHHVYETDGSNPQGTYELSKIQLLTPLINPPSVKLFEQTQDYLWYRNLNPMGLMPTEAQLTIPTHAKRFGVEIRPAAVVSDMGELIDLEEASTFILGFVLIVNFVALDILEEEQKLGLSSCFPYDNEFILGPLLVTPDELESYRTDDPYQSSYQWTGQIKINDQIVQTFSEEQKISFAHCVQKGAQAQGIHKAEILCLPAINIAQEVKPNDLLTIMVQGLGGLQVQLS